jgi:hypothetical protein
MPAIAATTSLWAVKFFVSPSTRIMPHLASVLPPGTHGSIALAKNRFEQDGLRGQARQ